MEAKVGVGMGNGSRKWWKSDMERAYRRTRRSENEYIVAMGNGKWDWEAEAEVVVVSKGGK
jgi:hypothetical protein